MRKLFLLIMTFSFLIMLFACHKTETKTEHETIPASSATDEDHIKPVITIHPNIVTIIVNEEVDFLDGVTAMDNVDGDLTSQITVNQGTFDKTRIGEYIITYRVTDQSGNVGIANKKIIVKEKDVILDVDTIVFQYLDEWVTKGDLYDYLKSLYGLETILEMVDRDLLSGYKDQFNLKSHLEESDYQTYLYQYGLVKGQTESNEAYEARILDQLSIDYLRQQAGAELIKAKLNNDTIPQLKESYREESCVLLLDYRDEQAAIQTLQLLSSLEGEAVFTTFESLWKEKTYGKPKIEFSYTPYLDSMLNCDYQVFEQKVFSELDELEPNTYNKTPIKLGNYNYLFYKINDAPSKDTYDQKRFEADLLNRYVFETYQITSFSVFQEREKANFKIHDEELYEQYGQSKMGFVKMDHVVATYQNKKITTTDLYHALISRYFLSGFLNQVNEKLIYFNGFNREVIKESDVLLELNQLVQYSFNNHSYYQLFDQKNSLWIKLNETDAKEKIRNQLVENNYILSVDPIDVDYVFNAYYNLLVSKISIPLNHPNIETVKNQLINGVSLNEEAFVFLNNQPFSGFNHIPATLRTNAYSALTIKGGLMSKITLTVSNDYKDYRLTDNLDVLYRNLFLEGEGAFKTDTNETEFSVYITNRTYPYPNKPENYDSYSEQELKQLIQDYVQTPTNEGYLIYEYYQFIEPIKERLIAQKLIQTNVNRYIIPLHQQISIEFHDDQLNEIYQAYIQQ